ncbi:MAG: hypothetical protein IKE04_05695 [Oscillospiraceae bacterium]|nr:hypothetical protein [Oscillospiraceae bacterium]
MYENPFSQEQQSYIVSLCGYGIDFTMLDDDMLMRIEDAVADRLGAAGFDKNGAPTEEGLFCEAIIDAIPD